MSTKFIKLSSHDPAGRRTQNVWINPDYIVGFEEANPSGLLVATVRGMYHVKQSPEQLLQLITSGD